MSQAAFDIIVVGAGIVGAAFSLALKDTGLSVALIEAAVPLPMDEPDEWDHRIYALSPANADWLKSLGVWGSLDAHRIAPIRRMDIYADQGGQLSFDGAEVNEGVLGYILESRLLQGALIHHLQAQESIFYRHSTKCQNLEISSQGVKLTLASGECLQAKLIVGADGGQSWIRTHAGITSDAELYAQQGLVANFKTTIAHDGVARQWFRDDGVLAWLPLGQDAISIVWSTPNAEKLLAMSPEAFTEEVEHAGLGMLGPLTLMNSPQAYPLSLRRVSSLISDRVALIGDAAHQVHPLAGQGVNLGLQDAKALAEVIVARGLQKDVGDFYLLRRYERSRKADVLAMQTLTDGLVKMFEGGQPVLRRLRNWGLTLMDHQHWLKKRLIHQAIGQVS